VPFSMIEKHAGMLFVCWHNVLCRWVLLYPKAGIYSCLAFVLSRRCRLFQRRRRRRHVCGISRFAHQSDSLPWRFQVFGPSGNDDRRRRATHIGDASASWHAWTHDELVEEDVAAKNIMRVSRQLLPVAMQKSQCGRSPTFGRPFTEWATMLCRISNMTCMSAGVPASRLRTINGLL
jgi:hypothetical protein